jgi:hypothetical protein
MRILRFDKHGNLYGVTQGGGTYEYGTLFGTFHVLHNFTNGSDGCLPSGSLVEYKGSLYGTTAGCVAGGMERYGDTMSRVLPSLFCIAFRMHMVPVPTG